jgi:HEAT repeat protein
VRAAAVRALANSRDPFVVETIAAALRDATPDVRRAAAEVLLWDGERRWGWVRFSVHAALADPELRKDGPLPLGGVSLPAQAVRDLHEWAGEGGGLGLRAAQTLVAYYSQILNARPDAQATIDELRQKVLDPETATALRVELAQMLAEQRLLDRETCDGLMAGDNPVPVRLVGAESALATGPDGKAESALREIARRPNREIALAVAQIVQRRFGTDLGLDLHHAPSPQSRRGAEVTRRVMEWAAEEVPKRGSKADLGLRPTSGWDLQPPDEPSGRGADFG